jgi:L-ribulokinase
MGRLRRHAYLPNPDNQRAYDTLYAEYRRLHDYFGRSEDDGGNEVMHRLRDLRDAAATTVVAADMDGSTTHQATASDAARVGSGR